MKAAEIYGKLAGKTYDPNIARACSSAFQALQEGHGRVRHNCPMAAAAASSRPSSVSA